MLKRLSDYIHRYQLFTRQQRLLLAVSGGVDSVVLAHLLHELDYTFTIAHCNFRLRGMDSDGDETFVRKLAENFGRKVHIKSFDTSDFAQSHGISIQMAARDLRRTWFDELLKTQGYEMIVTAHHVNDSIETALYNLTKGTGIDGLRGILPKNEPYVRPLLFASRNDILDYAKSNNLVWREDVSNASVKYHRNLIRHEVIPVLRQINPSIESSFQKSAERVAATAAIYRSVIQNYRDMLLFPFGDGFRIDILKLKKIQEPRQVMYELLEPFGFNYDQAGDFIDALDGQPGKGFKSSGYTLTIDRDFALLFPFEKQENLQSFVNSDDSQFLYRGQDFYTEFGPRGKYTIVADEHTALFDMDKLTFPLIVRSWREGDRFQPLGMKNKKKVSDFMIDHKIPLTLKESIPVFYSSGEIIWIAGFRIDERFKISEQTRTIFRISKRKNNV